MAAYWIGALTEVNVSLAMAAIAPHSHSSSSGNENTPSRHPPAPHHLLRPVETTVPSG
jgi:hypothetical protein